MAIRIKYMVLVPKSIFLALGYLFFTLSIPIISIKKT